MIDFTNKEWDMIHCILELTEKAGFPPTVREMQIALGYRSTSTVHPYIKRLAAVKAIRYEPAKPRTIVVLVPTKSRQ